MVQDFMPFLRHALAEECAKQIADRLSDEERQALLLWKAYLKRMRAVPAVVLRPAVDAYRRAEEAFGVQIVDAKDAQLVMDKVGELAWNKLDAEGQRNWLLRVV